jgi:o-succinylbenzoate synthase
MLKSSFKKYTLIFKRPSGTSRGILTTKDSWFLKVWHTNNPDIYGIGECSIIYGLSPDPTENYEQTLNKLINNIDYIKNINLEQHPSIKFGIETALKDLEKGGRRILFETEFTNSEKPIPINGLVWMGDYNYMKEQIIEKVNKGFSCIKLKIGAIDFTKELELLQLVRKDFKERDLELRVDANGAFNPKNALEKLKRLSDYGIHSIEQPIKPRQWEEMARLCELSPVDIALDEELISLTDKDIPKMLDYIKPQYIILKPSLTGGLKRSEFFIKEAEKREIGWWNTSALESNIGLNAIAQWTATLNNNMPQGLGTGQLYINNFQSPLTISNGNIFYKKDILWDISLLNI